MKLNQVLLSFLIVSQTIHCYDYSIRNAMPYKAKVVFYHGYDTTTVINDLMPWKEGDPYGGHEWSESGEHCVRSLGTLFCTDHEDDQWTKAVVTWTDEKGESHTRESSLYECRGGGTPTEGRCHDYDTCHSGTCGWYIQGDAANMGRVIRLPGW